MRRASGPTARTREIRLKERDGRLGVHRHRGRPAPPSGRLYHEFLRVPDLSAGIYVARGRRDRPAVAAHRGRAVLRRRRPRAVSRSEARPGRSCRARWSSSRRPSRIASTTSRSGWSCWSCSVRPRATAPDGPGQARARICATAARSASASSAPRPTSSWRKNDVDVVAGRQERLEARGPGRQLRVVVVVPSEAEIEERARSGGGRRLGSSG